MLWIMLLRRVKCMGFPDPFGSTVFRDPKWRKISSTPRSGKKQVEVIWVCSK